jgi:hypothetical protein
MGMLFMEETPGICFLDPNGTTRITMGLKNRVPRFSFYDVKNKSRMEMFLLEDGEPRLSLSDSKEEIRIVMGLLRDEPGLVFFDSEGNLSKSIP